MKITFLNSKQLPIIKEIPDYEITRRRTKDLADIKKENCIEKKRCYEIEIEVAESINKRTGQILNMKISTIKLK